MFAIFFLVLRKNVEKLKKKTIDQKKNQVCMHRSAPPGRNRVRRHRKKTLSIHHDKTNTFHSESKKCCLANLMFRVYLVLSRFSVMNNYT